MTTPTVLQHIAEIRLVDLVRVVDGDTWWAYVDVDFRELKYVEFRLWGWDTPEKQGPLTTAYERDQAHLATAHARHWWQTLHGYDYRFLVETDPDPEKYGRWLGDLWAEDRGGTRYYLHETLAPLHLAVPSNGTAGTRWRDTYVVGR